MSSAPTPTPSGKLSRSGLFFAFGAYGLWGLFPLYFWVVAAANPFELVSYRILFSLVFCAVLITFMKKWQYLGSLLTNKKAMLYLGLAAILIYINWQVFVIAVTTNQVVESSLGYFINPIFTVVLGVTVLREKLRPLQWVAVGTSFIAVVVLTVSYGNIPWISLSLAASFGLYGLIKKKLGSNIDSISSLTIETMWTTPIAIVQLVIVSNMVGLTLFSLGTWHTVLLMSAGIITAVPLILFGAGARRLPLYVIGLIQFSTPILTFLMAIFVFQEPMSTTRWIGVFIIWVAVAVLVFDMLRHGNANRLARAAEELTIE